MFITGYTNNVHILTFTRIIKVRQSFMDIVTKKKKKKKSLNSLLA